MAQLGLLSETIFAQVDEMWVKYGLIDIFYNVDHSIVHTYIGFSVPSVM